MTMVDHGAIEYYENNEEFGLSFKKPINPKVLIDAIKKIDGGQYRARTCDLTNVNRTL